MERMEAELYHSFIIQQEDHGMRLDKVIPKKFPLYSRSYIQRLIQHGHIRVNDKVTLKSAILQTGDLITISIPSPTPLGTKPIPQDIVVEIIYTHKDFLIINKPAGLLVHATNKESETFTLVDWLIQTFPTLTHIGTLERPGIVHRLDQYTSGLMIIPCTQEAYTLFGNLFQQREIKKTYLAVVQGHPDREGMIDLPIARNPIHRNKMTHKDPTGRAAITYYHVVEYFADANATLLELTPITGRTHQIRVHCAAIGHPIIGDTVYGQPSKLIPRQALHAYKLSFVFKNEEYVFQAEPPNNFLQLVFSLKKTN